MMLASAAMPFAIAPVTLGKHQLVDGGVVDIAPLRAAVAAGATDALVIMMSPLKSKGPEGRLKNLLSVGLRSLALLEDEIVRNDVRTLSAIARIRLAAPAQFDAALEGLRNLPGEPSIIEQYGNTPKTPDPVVIAPEYFLGGVLDFDSKVPAGWPEKPSGKPAVPIMKARFDYGQRHAERLIKAGGPVVDVLNRFKQKT
jgi:predicted acylesterase/phospholipase RssA